MVYLLTKICHSLLWIDCESLSKHAKLLPCNWCLRYQIAQLRNTFDFALKTRRWFGGKTSGNHHMVMKYWRDKDCLFSWRKLTPHRRQPKETNQKKNPGQPQHHFHHKKSLSFVACWSDRLLSFQSRAVFTWFWSLR